MILETILISCIQLNVLAQGTLTGEVYEKQAVPAKYDLIFDNLTKRWDEGVPLGNGMIGSLVWQKGTNLRLSIDRADLWDLRPVKEFSQPEFNHQWVSKKVMEGDYVPVQKFFDEPYVKEPGPTKIPGGALEFDISNFGDVQFIQLHLTNALCEIKWENGMTLQAFVHATEPVGWFRFENVGDHQIIPLLVAPNYSVDGQEFAVKNDSPWQDLHKLGYPKETIEENKRNEIAYHQQIWGGMSYDIVIKWLKTGTNTIDGVWSITTNYPDNKRIENPLAVVKKAFAKGFDKYFESHNLWWRDFWSKSSIQIPDTNIERQWYREIYKYGSASRRGAPPISLQAVWTADHGSIPPWKGDFHNDLNTQMSNWVGYSSNHLEESRAFTDWLTSIIPNCKKWTRTYFGVDGLNVPGVATVTGEPMGGWIQYAFSYTTAGWLAHHYYLQWRYSMDTEFLVQEAYPYFKEVATYFEKITIKQKNGKRKLPLSSSAEIHNNSINAWFKDYTTIDLSLIHFTLEKAAELSGELGLQDDKDKWTKLLTEFPGLPLGRNGGLLLAMDQPLTEPHRHHTHLAAIHPLGLISWEKGEQAQRTIIASLKHLEDLGLYKHLVGNDTELPTNIGGMAASWYANLLARSGDGEKAYQVLNYFAKAYVSKNSFHLNFDQLKGKPRVFTLEGNFGFAAAVQEMLLQSQNGFIRIFPAVPSMWRDVSFTQLRAEGAFLVSAKKENGVLKSIEIFSEKGGDIRLENPFGERSFKAIGIERKSVNSNKGIIELKTQPGMRVMLE